jgi:hypothetical protein
MDFQEMKAVDKWDGVEGGDSKLFNYEKVYRRWDDQSVGDERLYILGVYIKVPQD